MRLLIVLSTVLVFNSCDYLSFQKNENHEKLNMDIDFTSVDDSPSFKVCDTLIDKNKKTSCFRTTIRQEISNSLSNQSIKVKKSIDETILVTIRIQSNKQVQLTSMIASDGLLTQIPSLNQMIKKSIEDLPEIYPAIKRGIPVTTAYKLPIRIYLEN
tara:strand:+ start:322 stop:792 length:471 start_codon:yes stop_codon:yes gene_type:complete